MTQDNLATRPTIRVNKPVDLPAPTAQQIRKYAVDHGILVVLLETYSEQMMFNYVFNGQRFLSELELYNAIIATEV